MHLIDAGICRDGGSLVADFRLDDESLLSLMLEIAWSPGGIRSYDHLHVGDTIQNTCNDASLVCAGSAREAEIVRALNAWCESSEHRPVIETHISNGTYPAHDAPENHAYYAFMLYRNLMDRSQSARA